MYQTIFGIRKQHFCLLDRFVSPIIYPNKLKLSNGNANCLFALLSRATQVAKSKSACPDFIYRHDICAIYIFGGVEVLIALSVNRNSLGNCRQFVAKNNRTNTPKFSIVFVVLCASMCVAKVSITIALDCLDNCAICRC